MASSPLRGPPAGRASSVAAESFERLTGELVLCPANHLAAEVGRLEEGMADSEQPPDRSREDADSDDSELLDTVEHGRRDPALEHATLELVAIDEERGQQSLKTPDAEPVEDTRPDPGHVDLAGLDVFDRPSLRVRITCSPVWLELDPHRPVRAPGDLLREHLEWRLDVAVKLAS